MSGGMELSRRERASSVRIENAAIDLRDALADVEDAAFGWPMGAIDIVNAELLKIRLELREVTG